MRERVTFVQPRGSGVDPNTLQVQEAGLIGPLVDTVREDRLTLTLDELASDFSRIISTFKELHIRWATAAPHDTLEPFASRISPGFHLAFTPVEGGAEDHAVRLCQYITRFGQLGCSSLESFTSSSEPPSNTSPSFYFYEPLEDLHDFSLFAIRDLCPELDTVCQARVRSLHTASSLDISWDAASAKLKVTALWPLTEQNINVPKSTQRRTEVGVLAQDVPPNIGAHEIGVSGLLTVLGESKEPSPTLFSFPARHRVSGGTFTSKFATPSGLHPSLQLSLSSVKQPGNADDSCRLYSYLTLPNTIFADRYQLGDDLFLASKNLTSLRYTTLPVDLEAPAYTTTVWGSSILLELAPGHDSWDAEVPLHLRYLRPSSTGHVDIKLPYPALFWACDSDADAKFDTNPFDRTRIGYDGLFDDKTVFWHVTPRPSHEGQALVSHIQVPVLKEGAALWVETGTGVAVVLGFLWVLWVLVRVVLYPTTLPPPSVAGKREKKGR